MLYRSTVRGIGKDSQKITMVSRYGGRSPILAFVLLILLLFAALNMFLFTALSESETGLFAPMEGITSASFTTTPKHRSDLLPASIWATREFPNHQPPVNITSLLSPEETQRALQLCGSFLYSTLHRAVHVTDMANQVFVSTGDIDDMWIRDSVVQMTIYLQKLGGQPWLRFLVEGAIRRNAFHIVQDPYANAYRRAWKDPKEFNLKDQVIGRGGFVATRNYELDSGAYYLNHLYDYYVVKGIYRPEVLLEEPIVFEAIMLLIDTWIVEQRHDEQSPYRYFELPNEGKGSPTAYTGMTWTGFRPSDDACQYGYLVPANIHAAAALERLLILNKRIWRHDELETKASKLLKDIEQGIHQYGIVQGEEGERTYAYEVDGMGGILSGFDDANVPSLLSIPLLGWSGYDQQVYQNTRRYLLSSSNKYYYEGQKFKGVGSPHTPRNFIWPMALVIQGLTEIGADREEQMVLQLKQLLLSACHDAMHESVHVDNECRTTRHWFEWANALFVVYVEATMGVNCGTIANDQHRSEAIGKALEISQSKGGARINFHSRPYPNDHKNILHYQGVAASVQYDN